MILSVLPSVLRLSKISNTTSGPSINDFEYHDHFRSISIPPTCTWFDEPFRDLVCSVVKLSIHDLNDTECDWSIDDLDFRASMVTMVQSIMIEADRTQRDGQIDLDDISRRLVQARALLRLVYN